MQTLPLWSTAAPDAHPRPNNVNELVNQPRNIVAMVWHSHWCQRPHNSNSSPQHDACCCRRCSCDRGRHHTCICGSGCAGRQGGNTCLLATIYRSRPCPHGCRSVMHMMHWPGSQVLYQDLCSCLSPFITTPFTPTVAAEGVSLMGSSGFGLLSPTL